MTHAFDPQPTLLGPRLHLRSLAAGDLDGLQSAARSPAIWAGHPARDRWKPEVFAPYFAFLLGTRTTLVVIDRETDRIIGASRYYTAPDRPDTIAIGFTFLHDAYWGGATNRELKTLMLGHAFERYPEVWFHIAPTNVRSQKATAKLGAVFVEEVVLDLSGAPVPWLCYRLSREAWESTLTA